MAILAIEAAIEIGTLAYHLLDKPKAPRPPLANQQVSNAQNGAPIVFGYGTNRFAGQIIWTSGVTWRYHDGVYYYVTNFAVAFCEGPASIIRLWGDSKLIYSATPNFSSDFPVEDYPAWDPTITYNPGNFVAYLGQVYQCIVLNSGENPAQNGSTYWLLQSDYPLWQNDVAYNPGDIVSFGSQLWVCVKGNTDEVPVSQIPSDPLDKLIGNWGYWALVNAYYGVPTIYPGDENQLPDPTIQAAEGVNSTPAFRGLCYAVFTYFSLFNFGNRIPNLRAEVQFAPPQSSTGGAGVGNYTSTSLEPVLMPEAFPAGQLQIIPMYASAEGTGYPTVTSTAGDAWVDLVSFFLGSGLPFQIWARILSSAVTDTVSVNGNGSTLQMPALEGGAGLGWTWGGSSPDLFSGSAVNVLALETIPTSIISLNQRGAWDSTAWYAVGDEVTYSSNTWICIAPNKNYTPVVASGNPWVVKLDLSTEMTVVDLRDVPYDLDPSIFENQSLVETGILPLCTSVQPCTAILVTIPPLTTSEVPTYLLFVFSSSGVLIDAVSQNGLDINLGGGYSQCWRFFGADGNITSGEADLADVVTDICERAGLASSQIDVSLLTAANLNKQNSLAAYQRTSASNVVEGYFVDQPRTAAEILKVLMQSFFFDACETDGTVKFVPRGSSSVITIPESDLGLVEDKAKLIPEEIGQSGDLPQKLSISFIDPALDYQQNKQMAQRNTRIVGTRQQVVLAIPMTMDVDWARQVAEKALYITWLERFKYTMHLWSAFYMLLDPSDVVTFVYESANFVMRITQHTLGAGNAVELEGVSDNANSYISNARGGQAQGSQPVTLPQLGITNAWLFDIPLVDDSDANPSGTGFYAAASSLMSGWPGAILEDSTDNSNFTDIDTFGEAATFGYATNALAAPRSPWEWDTENTITVKLSEIPAAGGSSGSFNGDTQLNVLNGSNLILIASGSGYELVAFMTSVNNGDGTYTLSQLLRGLRGTEAYCSGHASGDVVMLISSGVKRETDALALIGQQLYYAMVTLGMDVSQVPSQAFTVTGNDLKPYAPVGVGGTVDGSGNIIITWARRTRIGGEADWADGVADVPLSEDEELYDVEILNGSSIVRTITDLTTPTAVYTAAMQTTDFGSAQSSVSVNVYQKSVQVGRGSKATGVAPTPGGWPVPWPAELPGTESSGGQLFYINGS